MKLSMKISLRTIPALMFSVVMPVLAQNSMPSTKVENKLPEVKVVGDLEKSYKAKRSTSATKTDTLLIDTPQSITVITKELIRDQDLRSMNDIARYVPGISVAQGEGNRDTLVFRGNGSTGDFFIDGIRDDVQYYRDFYNIDSVEALKGSNAMIFGRGGSGGIINRVSKQAEWKNIGDISVTAGSWNNRRFTLDAGNALNQDVALRVNAMWDQSDSFRKGFNSKRSGINPSIAIRAGENTSINLNAEIYKDERVADRGVPSFQGKPLVTNNSTFFGNAELSPTWSNAKSLSSLIEHDFGNGWTLRNRSRFSDYDKFYQNVYPGAVSSNGTTVAIGAYNNATQRKNFFNQTDFMFTAQLGQIQHQLLAGLELGQQDTDNKRNTGYFLSVSPTATSINVPVSDPIVRTAVTFKQSASDATNNSKANTRAIYIQDQIKFSPQWQAILGLRLDSFDVDFLNLRSNEKISVQDNPVSPRAGLIFKPSNNMSLYSSYSISFVPRAGDQLSSLNASNKAFDPEKFTNIELGMKWDISSNLNATAAIYQLDRSNVAMTDPLNTSKTILVDAQRSQGLEVALAGNVTEQWNIMLAYAYQDAKITKNLSSSIKAGATLAQVPTNSASIWNRYQFNDAWSAGLGVSYTGERFPSTDNTVVLPAYTRVDGALFYTLSNTMKLQLNIENIFNKNYYASAHNNNNITPGAPRNFKIGLHTQF
jgi:catecholate siderophore receptor